jgi:hypothetical protein
MEAQYAVVMYRSVYDYEIIPVDDVPQGIIVGFSGEKWFHPFFGRRALSSSKCWK